MRVLLPPERIEIQPIKVTNKPEVEPKDKPKAPHEEPPNEAQPAEQSVKAKNPEKKELTGYAEAERHEEAKQKESIKATRDKGGEAEDPKEETEEFGRSHAAELHAAEPHAKHEESVETEGSNEELEDLLILPEQVKESNRTNALFTEVREYLANPVDHDRPTVYLRGSRAANGLLYKDSKLWVAEGLRLDVI